MLRDIVMQKVTTCGILLITIIVRILGTNPCETNNGDCSHLCLLSATHSSGFSCACPDSLLLDYDQKNCTSNLKLMLDIQYL